MARYIWSGPWCPSCPEARRVCWQELGLAIALGYIHVLLLYFLAIVRRYPRGRDLALPALIGVLENLGYRQATDGWRARAFWGYWKGDLGWGRMERRGIASTRAGGAPSG